jgi:large subunit ribosomal protein L17
MVTSLFKHDRIQTTDAKAKELRRWADHVITLAKKGDLHARRQALAIVREKAVVHKLFEEAPKRFGSVAGGYTRVIKIGRRPGDAAPVSLIELITPEPKKKKTTKKAKTAAAPKAAPKKKAEKKSEPAQEAETKPEAVEDNAAKASEVEDVDQKQEAEDETAKAKAAVEAESEAPAEPDAPEDAAEADDKKE